MCTSNWLTHSMDFWRRTFSFHWYLGISLLQTIYDCQLNKLNRLNSVIEIATSSSSSSSQQGFTFNAIAWHLFLVKKKIPNSNRTTWDKMKKNTSLTTEFLFTITMIAYIWSNYICSIICYIQIQSGKKKKWMAYQKRNEKALYFASIL